ncbi:MAG: helix-turn-helix domain-containing protein [Mesorhizobium sp.]
MGASLEPALSDRLDFNKFESWQEATFELYSKTDCVESDCPDFRAWLSRRRFGGLVSGRAGSSPISYFRRNSDIRHDNIDDFVIVLMRQGRLRIAQGEGRVEVGAGDLAMYHQGAPFELSVTQECDAILLSVPAPMIISRTVEAFRVGGRLMHAGAPATRFVTSILANFADVDDLESLADQNRISSAALDIFASVITNAGGEVRPDTSRSQELLEKVKRHARSELENPDLTVASIALGVGVSERTLNRLFASQQTTPMRWLWEERLAFAYDALSCGQARNVTDAAFAFGFKDTSHFSRAFSRKFRQPPSSLLKRG